MNKSKKTLLGLCVFMVAFVSVTYVAETFFPKKHHTVLRRPKQI